MRDSWKLGDSGLVLGGRALEGSARPAHPLLSPGGGASATSPRSASGLRLHLGQPCALEGAWRGRTRAGLGGESPGGGGLEIWACPPSNPRPGRHLPLSNWPRAGHFALIWCSGVRGWRGAQEGSRRLPRAGAGSEKEQSEFQRRSRGKRERLLVALK